MREQLIILGLSGLESAKPDYGQEEAIAVFGHDPRVYQTTVKEFVKDKKETYVNLSLLNWRLKKTRKQVV